MQIKQHHFSKHASVLVGHFFILFIGNAVKEYNTLAIKCKIFENIFFNNKFVGLIPVHTHNNTFVYTQNTNKTTKENGKGN